MFLFLVSFLLVFVSSYFIVSMIAPKKSILGLIYLFVIAFAQVVLIFEILSLFHLIKLFSVLGINIIFFDCIWYVWFKRGKPLWSLDFKTFRNRLKNSLKLDKSLMWLFVGWGVLIYSAIYLCALMPITNADAAGYHVVRSLFWISQGSLNHFNAFDIRALCLPINSEILYTWVFLFIKKDFMLGFTGFAGYLLSIISVYNIVGLMGYSTRRKLWVTFILSSFASVLVQASGVETDIIIAGLISSSIFLFWYALKNNKFTPIVISALAYALALGTKTTAFLAVPGVGLFFIALCAHYKKFKPFSYFLGLGFLSFLIFSSYNYILNYIDFHNFMSSQSFLAVSKNYYGIKGMFANFIRHMFLFFDFTGFTWSIYWGTTIAGWKNSMLAFFHLLSVPDGLYTYYFHNKINNYILEPLMGPGVLGILVYLPCLLWSGLKPLFKFKAKKVRFLFGFFVLFFINLLTMSYVLAYMAYNVRFMMTFMVLSAPILIYSYFKKTNILKVIIVFFAMFYLVFVSTNLWPRQMSKIVKLFSHGYTISQVRYRGACQDYDKLTLYRNAECLVRQRLENQYSKDNKILIFMGAGEDLLVLKELEYLGYKVDFGSLENIYNIDLSKYNVVVANGIAQHITVINDFINPKKEYFFYKEKYLVSDDGELKCFYGFNKKIPKVYGGGLVYPYSVVCNVTKGFWQKNNFALVGGIRFGSRIDGSFTEYLFYENKNNPIIWKNDKK